MNEREAKTFIAREVLQLAREHPGDGEREFPITRRIVLTLMEMIENLPSDEVTGPDPVAGLVNASMGASLTIERFITLAVATGFELAAQDAIKMLEAETEKIKKDRSA